MNAHPRLGLDQPTLERIEALPEKRIPAVISALEYRYMLPVARNPKSVFALLDSMGEGDRGYLYGWVLALQFIGESFPSDLA